MHELAPAAVLCDPGGHTTHAEPAELAVPAAQGVHAVSLPPDDDCPAGQDVQLLCCTAVLYFPTGHVVQLPALLLLYVPDGQSLQGVAPSGEYCPAAHDTHAARPTASATSPAPHGEHHTGHGHPVGGDVLDADILALAHKALEHPALLEENDGMRAWRAAEPPEALFLVDDIYISAYLNRQGVPRVIVPWGDPNQAVAPVPYLKPALAAPMPSQPPRSADEPSLAKIEPNVGAIDALHGVAGFDAGNVAAVRFFDKAGWWDKPRWPL